jgi:hypothetical protein
MRKEVAALLHQYQESLKAAKTELSWNMVSTMKKRGARFLKRSDDVWWFEVGDDLAREKASVQFRTLMQQKPVKQQATQYVATDGAKRSRISEDNTSCLNLCTSFFL